MIDLVKLLLKAGAGGPGKVAFRREKYVPKGGPDGGQGGNGGDIILRATNRLNTLQHLAGITQIEAKQGVAGGKKNKTGVSAEDTVIEVPFGTTVWLLAENRISHTRRQQYGLTWKLNRGDVRFKKYYLAEESDSIPPFPEDPLPDDPTITKRLPRNIASIEEIGAVEVIELTPELPEVVLCQGGFGGRGNISFKSSSNTTPLEAEFGTPGEQKVVVLELRLLADVGLVGYPNAGKSTLLSHLTEARPKIANYPFTTLEPQLGVMSFGQGPDRREVVIADIPGLIEGASEGKGLGFMFLRHLEHCRKLIYVISLSDEFALADDMTIEEKANSMLEQYHQLQSELIAYREQLANKDAILAINKIDIYTDELLVAIEAKMKATGLPLFFISGITGRGLDELRQQIARV
jgi:GTP-binding protein